MRKKTEITTWLEAHRCAIESGELVVLCQDECHLLWGDVTGYVWGKSSERIEVPVANIRDKQTYYGTIDLATKRCLIQAYDQGNSDSTIAFLRYLMQQYPNQRIALLWDGATHHRSQALKDFLASVNATPDPEQWKITCIRFAPNDPRQNPIEDVWLQAKRFIRECYHLGNSFALVKWLFEFVLHQQLFNFPKLEMYGTFSRLN